jgi:DNA uptake protein ComE-like DNA-binding protein
VTRASALAWAILVAAPAAAGEAAPAPPSRGRSVATASKGTAARPAARVDLNSASRAELKTLPGIGDAEARKIIAGRPWRTKADLVTKGVIGEGRYVAIRNRIVAANPGGPAR